jgi:hypothetical protein
VRINNVGPTVVVAPEVRGSVDQVRATAPVSSEGASAYAGGRILVESMEAQQAPPVLQERRRAPRRADDRRKERVTVTIDTRVGQRRLVRRRASDEPPASIDIEA